MHLVFKGAFQNTFTLLALLDRIAVNCAKIAEPIEMSFGMSKRLNLSVGFADSDQFLNDGILRLDAYWIRALFARLRTLITTNHNMPV